MKQCTARRSCEYSTCSEVLQCCSKSCVSGQRRFRQMALLPIIASRTPVQRASFKWGCSPMMGVIIINHPLISTDREMINFNLILEQLFLYCTESELHYYSQKYKQRFLVFFLIRLKHFTIYQIYLLSKICLILFNIFVKFFHESKKKYIIFLIDID